MEPNQPVNPQLPVQPEISQDSKFSFIKYIKVWQIVILLILLIPTTAYFLGRNQTKPTTIVQSSQIPTPTPDPTANWKTYTAPAKYSKYFPFTFKYPEGSKIELGGEAAIIYLTPKIGNTFGPNIDFSLNTNNNCNVDISIKTTPITINDYSGNIFESESKDGTDQGACLENGKGQAGGMSTFFPKPIKSEDQIMFNQILSTFKFTQ